MGKAEEAEFVHRNLHTTQQEKLVGKLNWAVFEVFRREETSQTYVQLQLAVEHSEYHIENSISNGIGMHFTTLELGETCSTFNIKPCL